MTSIEIVIGTATYRLVEGMWYVVKDGGMRAVGEEQNFLVGVIAKLREWQTDASAVIDTSRACRAAAENERDALLAKVERLIKENQERSEQNAKLAAELLDIANLLEPAFDDTPLPKRVEEALREARRRPPLAMASQLEPERAFWYCYRVGGGGPTHRHESEQAARAEAQRLAREVGGKVQVLAAVCEVEFSAFTWTEFDERPF